MIYVRVEAADATSVPPNSIHFQIFGCVNVIIFVQSLKTESYKKDRVWIYIKTISGSPPLRGMMELRIYSVRMHLLKNVARPVLSVRFDVLERMALWMQFVQYYKYVATK